MTTTTKGTIEVIRHGQGWTLNVWTTAPNPRFLRPVTLLESAGEVDLHSELVRVARREFGEGVLRKSVREFLPTSCVAIFEVTR